MQLDKGQLISFECPRCHNGVEEFLYGPCRPCCDALAAWARARGDIILEIQSIKDMMERHMADGYAPAEQDKQMIVDLLALLK